MAQHQDQKRQQQQGGAAAGPSAPALPEWLAALPGTAQQGLVQHLLETGTRQGHTALQSLFKAIRGSRDLVLQHAPRITYRVSKASGNNQHGLLHAVAAREGGEDLSLTLSMQGCSRDQEQRVFIMQPSPAAGGPPVPVHWPAVREMTVEVG